MSDPFTTADKLLPIDPFSDRLLTEAPQWQSLPDWKSPDPKCRLLKGAVPEAKKYRRAVCNQGCRRHLYFKNRLPYEQMTGLYHECPVITIALMIEGYYDMIRISDIEKARPEDLPYIIAEKKKKNLLYKAAWFYWKRTKIVPKIKDIEAGQYLLKNENQ